MRYAMRWTPARLTRIEDVAKDIRLFEIAPEGGVKPAEPGAHLDIALVVGGSPQTRSYSIVAADETSWRIAVKLCAEGRGGSAAMFRLEPGAQLTISAPQNNFALEYDHGDYLLLAGGVGVTPLITMARALRQAGKAYRFVHVARSRAEAAFVDALSAAHGARYQPFFSREGAPLDVSAEIGRLAPAGQLYFCGPMRMQEATRRAWREAGRASADFRFETFASGGRYPPEVFTVRIPRLGKEVIVSEHETILTALTKAGVEIMSDCERGECGLCAVDVLAYDGAIDHRDVFLSEQERAENAKLCACISRAVGGTVSIDTAFRAEAGRLGP
jgi:vanillate O-demethylase ferredoxin subunit